MPAAEPTNQSGQLVPATSGARRSERAPSQGIAAAVATLRPELERISLAIFEHPETAFAEHQASGLLREFLAGRGFAVESPVAGLDTAFVARSGSGSPHVAFGVEYDALPGLGHGCGHNLIAAGGVVAAAALLEVSPDHAGTVLVIGTPGEEGGGGKVIELEQGVFDDVDALIMFHPADRTLPWRHARSSAHARVSFHGKAAHAAKNPEEGRNALAAMIQLYVALDGLRQHLGPKAQIHGVIRHGGDAPNVVPDFTSADFLLRHETLEGTTGLLERFTACAEGAALATGTTTTVEETAPRYAERKNNHTLAERVACYLESQGIAVEPASFSNPSGSSDIGNVSLALPVIHPYLAVAPRGTPGHSVALREAVTTPGAHDATAAMAVALAQAALDLLEDEGLLDAVKQEFATSGPDIE